MKKLEDILSWLFDLILTIKVRVYKVRGLLKEEFEAGEFIVDLDEPIFDIIELARPLKKDDKQVYYTNYWDYDTGEPRYNDWNGGSVSKITPLLGKVGKYYYSYRLATQKEIDRLKDPEGNRYDPNNKWKYDDQGTDKTGN